MGNGGVICKDYVLDATKHVHKVSEHFRRHTTQCAAMQFLFWPLASKTLIYLPGPRIDKTQSVAWLGAKKCLFCIIFKQFWYTKEGRKPEIGSLLL